MGFSNCWISSKREKKTQGHLGRDRVQNDFLWLNNSSKDVSPSYVDDFKDPWLREQYLLMPNWMSRWPKPWYLNRIPITSSLEKRNESLTWFRRDLKYWHNNHANLTLNFDCPGNGGKILVLQVFPNRMRFLHKRLIPRQRIIPFHWNRFNSIFKLINSVDS